MNHIIKFCISLLIVPLFLLGCSQYNNDERKINDGFSKSDTPTLQKIKINEILKPGALVLLKNYIVIQNEYNSNEDCFFVYTRDEIKFCYSFGRLGKSRTDDEFIAPRIIENTNKDCLPVLEQAGQTIYFYEISSKNHTLSRKCKINTDNNLPLQEFILTNDSILIYRNTLQELCSYNLNSDSIIDKITFNTDIKKKSGNNYNKENDSYSFTFQDTIISIGFTFINKIIKGNFTKEYHFKFNKDEIKSGYLDLKKRYNNYTYYMFLSSTKKYIFAQYMGLPFKVFQPFPFNPSGRNFNIFMEVYDWEMNKKLLIDFKTDILRFTIDEKNNCMYTWNPLKDFDYLYKYKLPSFNDE